MQKKDWNAKSFKDFGSKKTKIPKQGSHVSIMPAFVYLYMICQTVFVVLSLNMATSMLLFGCRLRLFGCKHRPFGYRHPLFGCRHRLFGCRHRLFDCRHRLFGCRHRLFGCRHSLCVLLTDRIRLSNSAFSDYKCMHIFQTFWC